MPMFPSNQPSTKVKRKSIFDSQHGRRFQIGLIICYLLIVFSWLTLQLITILYPQLMYDGTILAAYLVRDQIVTNAEIGPEPILSTIDFYIKVVLFIFNGFVGTMFLLIYVLPKMQNKNIWILTTLMIIGYCIPFINNIWNVLKNNDLVYYVTVNKILIVILNAPLTWSLILFGYYLYEEMRGDMA